eukprot:CAMPEP_0183410706 /NCGR_PEP_ID=MMETSP0370-20130417/19765_1 /TAXON_ID=268820 /ORGANISM="Peridinium aciculiferum, Strain PAER-2" /LENGTH=472 /DNA_ID=CAMNT_0025593581 /DNA_START=8 /DNA_END=1426 /DNA_ORIENTATION=-
MAIRSSPHPSHGGTSADPQGLLPGSIPTAVTYDDAQLEDTTADEEEAEVPMASLVNPPEEQAAKAGPRGTHALASCPTMDDVSKGSCRLSAPTQHAMTEQAGIEAAMSKAGEAPATWQNRQSTIMEKDSYDRGSVLVNKVLNHPEGYTQEETQQARLVQRAQQTGVMGSRAAADALATPGVNPYSIDQMGVDLLRRFRVKSFALISIQAISTLVIGVSVDAVLGKTNVGYAVLGVLVALTVATLLGVTTIRHKFPWNYIAECIFTIVAGCMLGCMSQPLVVAQDMYGWGMHQVEKPQLYAMAFYIFGLLILSFGSLLSDRPGRLMRCLPLALIAACLTMVLFGVVWVQTKFCPGPWLAAMMCVVFVSLVWVGLECDWLTTKLNPDEYMQPVILVWADLLVVTFVFTVAAIVCCLAFGVGGADALPLPAHAFCYCDCSHCYIYDEGRSTRASPSHDRDEENQHNAPAAAGAQG